MVKLRNLDKFVKQIFEVIENHQDELPFPVEFRIINLAVNERPSDSTAWLVGQAFMNYVAVDCATCTYFFARHPKAYLELKGGEQILTSRAIHALIFNIMHEVSHIGQETHCGIWRKHAKESYEYIYAFEIANDKNTIILCEKFIQYFMNELNLELNMDIFKEASYYLNNKRSRDLKYIPCKSWKNMLIRTLSSIFEIDLLHTPNEPIIHIIESKNKSSTIVDYLVDFRNTNDEYFRQASYDLSNNLLLGKFMSIDSVKFDSENSKITMELSCESFPETFVSSCAFFKDSGYKKCIDKIDGFSSYPNEIVYEEHYNY